MKKKSLYLLFLLALLSSACSSKQNWKLIMNIDHLPGGILAVNPVTGSIVALPAISGSTYFYYIEHPGDPSSIEKIEITDASRGVAQICFAEEVWLVYHDASVSSYNLETKTWTSHADMITHPRSGFARPNCYVTRDNHLIISDNNRVLLQNSGGWDLSILPEDKVYLILYQDEKGTLWALPWLDEDGHLYKLSEGKWIVVQEFDTVFENFIVAADGRVWLSNITGVYMWDPSESSGQVNVVLNEETNFPAYLFEDSSGNIWIVTYVHLWVYKENELRMAEFPQTLKARLNQLLYGWSPLWGAGFAFQSDGIVLEGYDSIWYANTGDIQIK